MRKDLYLPYFRDKKITVMGLGLLGRGIGDTIFLALAGSDITVTDIKKETELSESLEKLKNIKGITYHLGEHNFSDFENKDFILKAAGVPLDSPYIAHSKSKNIPVFMSAALLVKIIKEKMNNITVIGITGTRGKSTTTHLISHILQASGKRVHLGGNIRGMANFPLLDVIEEDDYLVLELDSWQLQGFHDLKISPDIAIFTSFQDDHLNYYKGDREAYFNDKAAIFDYQSEEGVLVVSPQAYEEISKRRDVTPKILMDKKFKAPNLIGQHNEVAASLSGNIALCLGIKEEEINQALSSFKPVEGRLERLGDIDGKIIYNDNNSTTPDATIAAIKSINSSLSKKPILIVGGSDKGLDLEFLKKEIEKNTKANIFLSGSGTTKLISLVGSEKIYEFEDLNDCFNKAIELASEGDVILFSPGFASFSNHFRNEYERNDKFAELFREKAYK